MNVKKKILAIDDVRDFPDADYIARTAKDGIRALREDGPWDLLHLDHDLASIGDDGRELNGYNILCWLEENPQYAPAEFHLVTANPVGRKNMEMVITNINRRRQAEGE